MTFHILGIEKNSNDELHHFSEGWRKTTIQVINRRKFRSQTSDNMDRWKAEQGRGREKRKIRRQKIRRERVRRKKMQMREKVGKSRFTVFFQWFVAKEGRKVGSLKRRVRSQLARWEMKNCTPLWREAHFEVKMYKTHHSRTTFGSWDVEKVHAVVARSTFWSQNVQNTSWHLEVEMSKKCTPLWREAHLEVKMLRPLGVRTTFGSSDLEKVHAVEARSTFEVKMLKTLGDRTTFGGSDDVASLRFVSLHYTIHSTTLQYITLHSTTTTTTELRNYTTTLHYTPLRSTTLNYTTLHHITLHSTTLHYITLHYTYTIHSTTLHYITLHYTLHYTTVHYTTLHSTTLQLQLQNLHSHYTSTTLHYTPLLSTTLHYTTLHSTTLHYIALHYTTFHYTSLHSHPTTLHYATTTTTQLHSITLNYTTLHNSTLHYATFHYTPLHYITLHYITLNDTAPQILTGRQIDRQIDR